MRTETCPDCDGGAIDSYNGKECQRCAGRGSIPMRPARVRKEDEDKFFSGFTPWQSSSPNGMLPTHTKDGYQLLTVRITRAEFLKLPMAARRRILAEASLP